MTWDDDGRIRDSEGELGRLNLQITSTAAWCPHAAVGPVGRIKSDKCI